MKSCLCRGSSLGHPTGFAGLFDRRRTGIFSLKRGTRVVDTTLISRLRLESRAALVRILVVDDNPAVRRYLRTILEQQSEWRVCGEARTAEETLQIVQNSIPDLILLDFQLPDQNGLEVAREIHRVSPATPILMVTIHMSNQLAEAAKLVGIRGICAKSDVGSIEEAVHAVLDEKSYFPRLTSLIQ